MSPPTESKQPFVSLVNTYYFYTETLCKTISLSYTGKVHMYIYDRKEKH